MVDSQLLKNLLFVFVLLGLSLLLFASIGDKKTTTSSYDVKILDESKVYPGYNLFNSTKEPYAVLVDTKGEERHRWQLDSSNGKGWHHVEPTADGHLLAISTDSELIKLDWDSNVIWKTQGRFHHDVDVLEDGRVFSLTRGIREIDIHSRKFPILDDKIAILSKEGELLEEISLYDVIGDLVAKSEYAEAYRFVIPEKNPPKPDSPADIFHTNSLEVLRADIPGIAKKGDILLSVRQIDSVVIIDLDTKKHVWHWGKNRLQRQHDAKLLPNGNVLIFDNGTFREKSRAVELNPITKEIEWSYGTKAKEHFFCSFRGGVQKLPNGNYLISNSDKDVAFEIDGDHRRVWSLSLRKATSENKKKSTQIMYRMRRIPLEHSFATNLS